MRAGEILALKWADVDLEKSMIRVGSTLQYYHGVFTAEETKTKSSNRTIALPTSIVSALRSHRAGQLEEHLRLGSEWKDQGYVFVDEFGNPIRPGEMSRKFLRPLLAKAGLTLDLKFHDLRHTAISLALAAGIAPTDVAAMAGHSSVAVTLQTYAHALPDAPRRATDAIESVLAGS